MQINDIRKQAPNDLFDHFSKAPKLKFHNPKHSLKPTQQAQEPKLLLCQRSLYKEFLKLGSNVKGHAQHNSLKDTSSARVSTIPSSSSKNGMLLTSSSIALRDSTARHSNLDRPPQQKPFRINKLDAIPINKRLFEGVARKDTKRSLSFRAYY